MIVSNQELLEASTQIERAGKAFYAELSKYVKDPTAREFLKVMAQEEALHEEQFKELLADSGDKEFGWEGEQKLRDLIDDQFTTDIFPPVDEIMSHVSEMEGIEKLWPLHSRRRRCQQSFMDYLEKLARISISRPS